MQLGEQVQRLSEALLGISGVMTCPQPGVWTHGRDHCKARVNLDVSQQASERTCNHVAAFHATGNAGTCRQAPNDERCFTMPSYYHQTAAGFQLPRARARKEIYSGPSHPTILIL